jgi:hypothetical protein
VGGWVPTGRGEASAAPAPSRPIAGIAVAAPTIRST